LSHDALVGVEMMPLRAQAKHFNFCNPDIPSARKRLHQRKTLFRRDGHRGGNLVVRLAGGRKQYAASALCHPYREGSAPAWDSDTVGSSEINLYLSRFASASQTPTKGIQDC